MSLIPAGQPIRWNEKAVLAALEETEGVDPEPGGGQAVRLFDVTLTAMGDKQTIPYIQPYMGSRPSVLLGRHARLSGKFALVGAGTAGSAPPWEPFIRAVGTVATTTAKTATATIAAAKTAVGTPGGAWTYVRTTAYGGPVARTATVTCTTGGASGAAKVSVTAPAADGVAAYAEANLTVTTGSPLTLPGGAVITPTITTDLVSGDSWTIALTPPEVRYQPVSDRSLQPSLALYFYIGTELHKLLGSRTSLKFAGSTQGQDRYPAFEFDLLGLVSAPTQSVPPALDFSDWPDPIEVSTDNTPVVRVHGHDLVVESFSWDAGNQVNYIERIGSKGIRIADRASKATVRAEAPLLSEADFFALSVARTQGGLVIQHGTAPGGVVRLDSARYQLDQPGQAESQGDYMLDLAGDLLPSSAGNDEWTLTVR